MGSQSLRQPRAPGENGQGDGEDATRTTRRHGETEPISTAPTRTPRYHPSLHFRTPLRGALPPPLHQNNQQPLSLHHFHHHHQQHQQQQQQMASPHKTQTLRPFHPQEVPNIPFSPFQNPSHMSMPHADPTIQHFQGGVSGLPLSSHPPYAPPAQMPPQLLETHWPSLSQSNQSGAQQRRPSPPNEAALISIRKPGSARISIRAPKERLSPSIQKQHRPASASQVAETPSTAVSQASPHHASSTVPSISQTSSSTTTSVSVAPLDPHTRPASPFTSAEDWTEQPLDRYAPTFVPHWLRQVNEDNDFSFLPAMDTSLKGFGYGQTIDYHAYASDIWPLSTYQRLQCGLPAVVDPAGEETSLARCWPASEVGPTPVTRQAASPKEPCDYRDFDPHTPSPILQCRTPAARDAQTVLTHSSPPPPSPARPPCFRRQDEYTKMKLPFHPETYGKHWHPLLQAEMKRREQELVASAVYAQPISLYNRRASEMNAPWDPDGLYVLHLPGVREERPKLVAGDRIFLRPVHLPEAQNPAAVGGWMHVVLECFITAVRAVRGDVVIFCPALNPMMTLRLGSAQKARFNVIFGFEPKLLVDGAASVDLVAHELQQQESNRATVLQKWLFPVTADLKNTLSSAQSGPEESIVWCDSSLNPEQRAAIRSIVSGRHSVPFILSGPPGTGKTKTTVEAVLQILSRHPQHRVLLVAPSDAASDVLAVRLSKHLKPGHMLRLCDSTRTFAEVPEELSAFTYIDTEKNIFSLPPWRRLMQTQVVVTAAHDVAMLHRSQCATNMDLGDLQLAMGPAFGTCEVKLHWTHLLIDEAAQATEPDLAPALTCVLPHPKCAEAPTLVLVGDPAQLGPSIRDIECRSQGMDVSLLERLSRLPVYSKALAELKRKGRAIVISNGRRLGSNGAKESEQSSLPHCGHLIRNYRARHPALLHLPSTLFYADSLVPASQATPRSLSLLTEWPLLAHQTPDASFRKTSLKGLNDPFSTLPMLFVDVRSDEEWVDEGVSWWNEGEAEAILLLCRSLLLRRDLSPQDIAVISPFREQVWRVRLLLRANGLSSVRVGPIEAYQGQESPIVIVSPVRSRMRFVEEDRQLGAGVIGESKRLNVAFTRARELLIIVGNQETLGKGGEEWRRVLGHARRNHWMIDTSTLVTTLSKEGISSPNGKTSKLSLSISVPVPSEHRNKANGSASGHQEANHAATAEAEEEEEISALEFSDAAGGESVRIDGWWFRMAGLHMSDEMLWLAAESGLRSEARWNPKTNGGLCIDQAAATLLTQNPERVHEESDRSASLLAGRVAAMTLQADEDEED